MSRLLDTPRILVNFYALIRTLRHLQSDKGCQWDRAQSPHSLRKHLIEEAQELVEAIEKNDKSHITEECGDLLLVLLLMINSKKGVHTLSLSKICRLLNAKLIRRHPHILGNRKTKLHIAKLPERRNWWEIAKQQERDSALKKKTKPSP